MLTVDEILHAHGYHDGSDADRLMQVFRDLARTRAVSEVYWMSLGPERQLMAEDGVRTLVDS